MTKRREPTIADFLMQNKVELTNEQILLASSLIYYRRKHFSMGYRAGRTTVIEAVQEYFEKCKFPDAGREI